MAVQQSLATLGHYTLIYHPHQRLAIVTRALCDIVAVEQAKLAASLDD